MKAKFDYGQKVRVIKNIRNDGTVMGKSRGALLIRRGSEGYVRSVGKFLQDQVVYQVHFIEQDSTIGCKEQELLDVNDAWSERRFERGDKVECLLSLAHQGEVVVAQGQMGNVLGLVSDAKPHVYRVSFSSQEPSSQTQSQSWQIPEKALQLIAQSETSEVSSLESLKPSQQKAMISAEIKQRFKESMNTRVSE